MSHKTDCHCGGLLVPSRPIVLSTELPSWAADSWEPDPALVSMFCARRRVFSRLAAAVAERPVWLWEGGGRDTLGSGVAVVVVVLAMEDRVWTRELSRGVVRFAGEAPKWLGVE